MVDGDKVVLKVCQKKCDAESSSLPVPLRWKGKILLDWMERQLDWMEEEEESKSIFAFWFTL